MRRTPRNGRGHARPKLKINYQIMDLLKKAQEHLNDPTRVSKELRELLHSADRMTPLRLYLDTWVRPYLDAAIRQIEEVATAPAIPDARKVTQEEYDALYERRAAALDDMPGGAQGTRPQMDDVEVDDAALP